MPPVLAVASLLVLAALAQEAPPPAPAAPAPPPPPDAPATLEVTSTGTIVTVARIEGHSTGVGYGYALGGGGGGMAAVYSTHYRDLCMTPCRVELPPGFHELSFYGQGARAVTQKYSFQPGETRVLSIAPGSFGTYVVGLMGVSLGASLASIGGIGLLVDAGTRSEYRTMAPATEVALIGSGVALTGLGIWGMKASRTVIADVTPRSVAVAWRAEF